MEQRGRRFRREGAAPSAPKADAGRRPAEDEGRELVIWVIGEHASSLLGTARRYSLCADDAYDAYQRALEILLRRASTLDRTSVLPWLRTVVWCTIGLLAGTASFATIRWRGVVLMPGFARAGAAHGQVESEPL